MPFNRHVTESFPKLRKFTTYSLLVRLRRKEIHNDVSFAMSTFQSKPPFQWMSNWQMSSGDYRRHQICHSNHPPLCHIPALFTAQLKRQFGITIKKLHTFQCEWVCATSFFHSIRINRISHASDLIKFRNISAKKSWKQNTQTIIIIPRNLRDPLIGSDFN